MTLEYLGLVSAVVAIWFLARELRKSDNACKLWQAHSRDQLDQIVDLSRDNEWLRKQLDAMGSGPRTAYRGPKHAVTGEEP